jgi:hypothetical protein
MGRVRLNIDGCRVGNDEISQRRWPANFIHDGSDEVMGCFRRVVIPTPQPDFFIVRRRAKKIAMRVLRIWEKVNLLVQKATDCREFVLIVVQSNDLVVVIVPIQHL